MTDQVPAEGRTPVSRRRSVRDEVMWQRMVALLQAQCERTGKRALNVLDTGGGTGHLAVPIAALDHHVTVVDPSPDSLAALQRRAAEAGVAGKIHAVPGDASSLPALTGQSCADVVVCHNVLEYVDDPAAALSAIATTLRPDAWLSVVGAGRNAAVLAKALSGQLDEAVGALADPHGRWGADDPSPRRFTWSELTSLVEEAGLTTVEQHGVRVFSDLVPGATLEDPEALQALVELERRASTHQALQAIATQLHLLARRTTTA